MSYHKDLKDIATKSSILPMRAIHREAMRSAWHCDKPLRSTSALWAPKSRDFAAFGCLGLPKDAQCLSHALHIRNIHDPLTRHMAERS